ncbi:hypothetical protein LTR56_003907 [Elasticomyces elasticus]|nr:hypothetical protein LTR56_003907 [Elasticomyces elasticus]KAK3661107.1 hypothetical protein LTR22_007733 [Elasticomyces elasticus]KAK4921113.1 hypothetical protein LTR49_011483 [Elasticomyces elasticus]KAK5748542.1 hypothetical protein LTS12_021386 [Elasticomyces elasticus]
MTKPNAHTVIDQACLDEVERRKRLRAERQQAREEPKKPESVFDDRVPGSRFILTARAERKSLPTATRVAAILDGAPALGEISLRAHDLLHAVEAVLTKRPAIDLGAAFHHRRAARSAVQGRAVTAAMSETWATQRKFSAATTVQTAAERLGELRKYAYMHERNLHRLMEAPSGRDEDSPGRTQQATTAATHAEIDRKLYGRYSSVLHEPLSESAIIALCLARCTSRAIVYELKAQKSNSGKRLLLEAHESTGKQDREQHTSRAIVHEHEALKSDAQEQMACRSTRKQTRLQQDNAEQKWRLETDYHLKKMMLEQDFAIKRANLERDHRNAQMRVENAGRNPPPERRRKG